MKSLNCDLCTAPIMCYITRIWRPKARAFTLFSTAYLFTKCESSIVRCFFHSNTSAQKVCEDALQWVSKHTYVRLSRLTPKAARKVFCLLHLNLKAGLVVCSGCLLGRGVCFRNSLCSSYLCCSLLFRGQLFGSKNRCGLFGEWECKKLQP